MGGHLIWIHKTRAGYQTSILFCLSTKMPGQIHNPVHLSFDQIALFKLKP